MRILKNMLFMLIIVILSGCSINHKNSYTEYNQTTSDVNEKNDVIDITKDSDIIPNRTLSENIEGNIPSNISNLGVVVSDGDWEYFWAASTESVDGFGGGKLCRTNPDRNKFQVLSEDKPAYLNVVGDWLYYIKQQEGKSLTSDYGQIYRIKKDGQHKEKVCDSNATYMTVVGEWIYFINELDGKVYKIRTNGSDLEKLNESKSSGLQYEDSWLYYISKDSKDEYFLYKLNPLLPSEPIKVTNELISDFTINNGWIYYCLENQKGLYRMKDNGTHIEKVFEQPIYTFSIMNDLIYCFSQEEYFYSETGGKSRKLFKMRLDGTQITEIPNDKVIRRSHMGGITNNYIYYWISYGEWFELARMKHDGSDNEILIKNLK